MWLVLWVNPVTREKEWEEYPDRAGADAALLEFSKAYPWNTYRLCEAVLEVGATEKYVPLYTITYEPAPQTDNEIASTPRGIL